MKPSWKYAPYWAKYLAQDENGGWYWFETMPVIGVSGQWWVSGGQIEEADAGLDNWMDSLEERE